jgi:hypothetical protein
VLFRSAAGKQGHGSRDGAGEGTSHRFFAPFLAAAALRWAAISSSSR